MQRAVAIKQKPRSHFKPRALVQLIDALCLPVFARVNTLLQQRPELVPLGTCLIESNDREDAA
jgi:hypothetical protein